MINKRSQSEDRCRRTNFGSMIGGLFLIFALASIGSVFAGTLEDYRLRIELAQTKAGQLLDLAEDLDDETEAELLASLRNLLPRTEKIVMPDGEITTNNEWLTAALLAAENEADPIRKEQLLGAIVDRLESISEHISELEQAIERDRSKDEDKQKLAEILARAEFQKAPAPGENLLQKWIREFQEWLARVFPSPNLSPGVASGFGSIRTGLQILLFLLIFGIVALAVYKLLPLISLRSQRKKAGSKSDRIILGETIAADATTEGLFGEAEGLAREGRLRDALRKGYIAALVELSNRKLIRLARHRTNRDYLCDLGRDKALLEEMRHLTGSFERNWYGSRNTEAEDWDDFRVRYLRAIANSRR